MRDRDIPTHTTDLFDLTSVPVDEFAALVPPFEAAFLGYRAAGTLQGRRRQARRSTTSTHCPLPTPAERLLVMLLSLTQHTMPRLPGRLFGMRQSQATPWLQVFLAVVRNPLRPLGDAPWRRVEALREPLGMDVPPLPLAVSPGEDGPAATPTAAPLFVLPAPSAPCRAPMSRLNSNRVIAASKSGPGCQTSW